MKIEGACHCGYITYEAVIDPNKVGICHCTDCQTLSGSAFRTLAFTREGTFELLTGELKIYVKTSESGIQRPQSFCPECGTPIYSTSTDDGPKVHSLRAGTIRQRNELVPRIQFWTQSEQSWISRIPSFPKLEKQ
ncbi:MAG: GFA family protein [Alphaproteobacteria bacterium]|nr:GFA family protein [Alphaproteobacteria bacterium]